MTGGTDYRGQNNGDARGAALEPAVAGLLYDCWNHDPERRPTFAQIVARLDAMLEHTTE